MRPTACVIPISLLLLALGCGGDGAVEKAPDQRRANAIVGGLYSIDGARATGNGTGVALSLRFLALDLASSIAAPEMAEDGAARARLGSGPAGAASGPAAAISGCNCTAAGCDFSACGDDTPELGWQLRGSLSVTGDRTTFDVSYMDRLFTWSLTGDLRIAADRASGTLSTEQECCAERTTTVAEVELRDVVVDPSHCPIGGTLHGDIEVTVPGDPTRDYHVAGDLELGPACAIDF